MEFNATFLVSFVSFIVFVVLMNQILYRPLDKIVRERKQFVDGNYNDANTANQKASALIKDRADRIGTKGTVSVITLCCRDTIDERIEELVEKKGQIADALVDGKISIDDINYLLS